MSRPVSRLRIVGVVACLALTACSNPPSSASADKPKPEMRWNPKTNRMEEAKGETLSSLFKKQKNPAQTVAVNKYIWNAALEVLNFLPIQSADPFSGLIVTGYGTPPGGRTPYRATILVSDAAMDARSLNISLMTRSGPVDDKTRAAVEDAILTRARQLRVVDLKL